jgi:hypothetical protein
MDEAAVRRFDFGADAGTAARAVRGGGLPGGGGRDRRPPRRAPLLRRLLRALRAGRARPAGRRSSPCRRRSAAPCARRSGAPSATRAADRVEVEVRIASGRR